LTRLVNGTDMTARNLSDKIVELCAAATAPVISATSQTYVTGIIADLRLLVLEGGAENVEELAVLAERRQKSVGVLWILHVAVVERLSGQRGHLPTDGVQYRVAGTNVPLLDLGCVYVCINAAVDHSQHLVTYTVKSATVLY